MEMRSAHVHKIPRTWKRSIKFLQFVALCCLQLNRYLYYEQKKLKSNLQTKKMNNIDKNSSQQWAILVLIELGSYYFHALHCEIKNKIRERDRKRAYETSNRNNLIGFFLAKNSISWKWLFPIWTKKKSTRNCAIPICTLPLEAFGNNKV